MSSVPAETAAGNPPAATTEEASGLESRSDMLFGFNRLNLLRQIGLMVGLAASVALGVAVVLWAQEPNYQPVLGDLSSYNPQDVTTILEQNNIDYRLEPRTGALLVPADDVYNARLKLAAEGVTDDRTIGYELLDQERGLGTSQFMETISYRRGLEGELARTISSMRNVRNARVHLAIPKRSVFVRDARTPTASVFLEVFAGRRLEQEQIAAIMNLVAGSIPEMTKDNVTVVDQSGNLLTGRREPSSRQQMQDQIDYNTRVEERLTSRVASIVGPIVGDGRFRAEVTADLDFSSVEQAEELFNPDQQAVRSERELTEQRSSGFLGGVPGALSNQPPGEATVPEQAAQPQDGEEGEEGTPPPVNVRSEATRNYEMDRTVSYIRQEQGRVKRLTVAVAVDDMKVVDPQTGEVSYEPWPEQELQRLTMLIRDAVGYSAVRGDSVTVMNTAFAPEEAVEFEAPGFWEQPWFWDLMKQVLAGLVILVLVLGLLRPTLKSLSGSGRRERGGELEGEGGYEDMKGLGSDSALREALSSQDELLLPGATDSYDRQLNALKGLITEDPARVAQVMRQWVNVDE
ncbi:MAG: flagellar basal-body MS-ring/collar protein FliF [Marinobacter sp.]|uniref:flagellar basal-body MS-ring/collar protein FliF n=1 Tax=Marinobacter sp. TaxID=50741 RepID=UPI00299EF03A|nr:flagellar basal-body MS-ring/collar protein FliF [Marinobacter sp.]MDX1757583.1 flagellar basal-body MS-ring/collar protein FliF [Marinobacter sp.]